MSAGRGCGPRKPGEHVGAVELEAVQAVGLLRAGRVRLHALDLLAQQAGAPQQVRDDRHLEREDVPRVQELAQRVLEPPRRRAAQLGAEPRAGVVEARARERRVGGDPPAQPVPGDGVPGLDRAPVVGDQVHLAGGLHLVDDRPQVVGQLVQPVGRASRRLVRLSGPADVVGDDAVFRDQPGGYPTPHRAVVRIAVHEHDRGHVAPAVDGDGEADTVAGGHPLVRHSVMLDNLSTASSPARRFHRLGCSDFCLYDSVFVVPRETKRPCPPIGGQPDSTGRWSASPSTAARLEP